MWEVSNVIKNNRCGKSSWNSRSKVPPMIFDLQEITENSNN